MDWSVVWAVSVSVNLETRKESAGGIIKLLNAKLLNFTRHFTGIVKKKKKENFLNLQKSRLM